MPMLPQKALFALWIFTDKYRMASLGNHIINLVFAAISPSQGLVDEMEVLKMVYEHTAKGAGLHKMVAEAAAIQDWPPEQLQKQLSSSDQVPRWLMCFTLDVLAKTRELASRGLCNDVRQYWIGVDVCNYHHHDAVHTDIVPTDAVLDDAVPANAAPAAECTELSPHDDF